MTFHCMFEQSGTFKNEFKKLGYLAFDYDILNDFGETDFQIDIFNEINNAYNGVASIFDKIGSEDLIFAFFPCLRFESQILLWFQGNEKNLQKKDDIFKLELDLKLHKELHDMYCLITKLVIVCLKKQIKLIIENPYSNSHYLNRYWSIKPKIIDFNRMLRGDYFVKPTQFWFINFSPKNNLIFEGVDFKVQKKIIHSCKLERSIISSDYANRFIREFILD